MNPCCREHIQAALVAMIGGCTPSPTLEPADAPLAHIDGPLPDASLGGSASFDAGSMPSDVAGSGLRLPEATGWQRDAYDGPDLFKLVMTLGGDLLAIADDGTVRRRAGARWELLAAAGEAQSLPVRDLIGFAKGDLWAIAYKGPPNRTCGLDFRPGTGAILHHDGRAWQIAKKVDGHKLTGLWGTGPRNVWVTASKDFAWDTSRGQKGTAAIHFDGVAWHPVIIPGLEQADHVARAEGVWGTAPDDVWIFGGVDATFRFDGHTFAPVDVGTALPPAWGSRDDVWFVGGGRLMRWKAGRVRVVSLPCDTGDCWRAIAGASPEDIWVTGGDGKQGLVAHGDGEHWSVERMVGAPADRDPSVASIVFDGTRFVAVTPVGLMSHGRATP